MKTKIPVLWIVVFYVAVHFSLVFSLPYRLSWIDTFWIILAQLGASFACFRAASTAPNEARILWRLLAGTVLLAPIASGLFMHSKFPGRFNIYLAPEYQIFLNTLYHAILLLIVSMQFDPRVLRPIREMSAFLAVAIGALWFVLVFSVISIQGSNQPAILFLIAHIFNAISLFLALVATIRLLGSDNPEERCFFYVTSIFLWVNAAIPAIRNLLFIRYDFTWLNLLNPFPYLFLIVFACRKPAHVMEFWHPSFRVASIVRSGGTAFLSFGLLLLGTAVSRMHFWIGATAALLSVLCYSVLNLITLARGLEAEEALLAAKQKMEELAGLDGLTGIPNRRTLDQRLDFEFQAARRSGQPLSVLMIDVDHFKSLNDLKGHLVGDSYLVRVARALRDALSRTNDFVARYGGEEFVILLPTTGDMGAMRIAGRLHAAISNLRLEHPASPSGRLTVSIGCTTADIFTHQSPIAMLRAADRALYAAKMHGRNRTEFLPFEFGAVDMETAS